jgi:hypothetical protein
MSHQESLPSPSCENTRMILSAISEHDFIPYVSLFSLFYVLLVVLFIWLFRLVELKLISLGLLTALLSVLFSQLPGEAVSVQVGPGPASAMGRVAAGGETAGILARIAVLLILGGLALILLNRLGYPAPTCKQEEANNAKPV